MLILAIVESAFVVIRIRGLIIVLPKRSVPGKRSELYTSVWKLYIIDPQ